MKLNKIYLLLAVFILILVGILLFLIPSTIRRNGDSPVPTPFQSNGGDQSKFEEPSIVQNVQVVKALPANTTDLLPIQEIALTFSAPMNPSNVKVEVNPQTDITIRLDERDQTTVIISPVTAWATGVTKITVLPSTKSLNLVSLKESYTYEFTAKFPDVPPAGMDDY